MTDETIEITIPIPPPVTHPNARAHRSIVAKARAKQRGDAHLAAIAEMNRPGYRGEWKPSWQRVKIESIWHKPGKKSRMSDADGLIAHLKSSIDGLEDAGVILNDRGVEWISPRQIIGAGAKERKVVLRVTPIQD